MTLTPLIIVNALLAAAVIGGMTWLLGSAIRADRRSVPARGVPLWTRPEGLRSDRLAA
jgi:hypothetical protein